MESKDHLEGNEPTPTWLATPEAAKLLAQLPRRRSLYQVMLAVTRHDPAAARAFAPLARALLPFEVSFRQRERRHPEENDTDYRNLYRCALVLCEAGDVHDVLPLWRAKMTNMDTCCGMDVQLLIGAGLEATRRHLSELAASGQAIAQKALDWITKCATSGDFDNLGEWRRLVYGYLTQPY